MSNDADEHVRCWTCKSKGIDRFFNGDYERQLHESTLHESRYLPDKWMTTSSQTHRSFENGFTAASEFGLKQSENGKLCSRHPSLSIS